MGFWSLEPEVVLPPWSNRTAGFAVERPCTFCHRDGFFDVLKTRLALVYDTIPAVDILATWERFGNSGLRVPFDKSLFAVPRLIVSDRVREILGDYKGVEFCEVQTAEPNHSLQPTAPSGRG